MSNGFRVSGCGKQFKMHPLPDDWPNACGVKHQPLNRFPAHRGTEGQQLPRLVGQVEQDGCRFEQRYAAAVIYQYRDARADSGAGNWAACFRLCDFDVS